MTSSRTCRGVSSRTYATCKRVTVAESVLFRRTGAGSRTTLLCSTTGRACLLPSAIHCVRKLAEPLRVETDGLPCDTFTCFPPGDTRLIGSTVTTLTDSPSLTTNASAPGYMPSPAAVLDTDRPEFSYANDPSIAYAQKIFRGCRHALPNPTDSLNIALILELVLARHLARG